MSDDTSNRMQLGWLDISIHAHLPYQHNIQIYTVHTSVEVLVQFYPDRPHAHRGNAYAREERKRARERQQGAGGRPE